MSALLSLNPIPMITWKDRTFNQIHSSLQKNQRSITTNNRSFFSAQPLKIYRKEIANTGSTNCNSRSSLSIDAFNRPGGTIINSKSSNHNGLVNTINMTLPNNKCDSEHCSVILSPSENARNRVRSSGMIRRKFNESKNNDTYYTSSSQYLNSRNRTFAQNQYNYIRQGNSNAQPGSSLASANVYAPQGQNHCTKYYISQTTFQYKWINSLDTNDYVTVIEDTFHDITIDAGHYTLDDVNRLLQKEMFNNFHYLLKTPSSGTEQYYSDNIIYHLRFAHNSNNNMIELHSYRIDDSRYPTSIYTLPTKLLSGGATSPSWSMPINGAGLFPQIQILDNEFKSAIGFNAGIYPALNITTVDNYQIFISTVQPGIEPLYVKLYYKPNNPQFGQQGGVSSGDLITRKKYNAITNSTSAYRTAFGNSVANALAYGVPEYGYTVKDKIGYPIKKTPTFKKYSSEMQSCSVTSIANMI